MIIALPYISSVFALFFLYLLGKYKTLYQSFSVLAVYFFLIIFFGLRGYIFTDVFSYKPFYDNVPDLITMIKTNYVRWTWWEPGFIYYCGFFKLFTDNYFVFQFFDTLIDLILLSKALKWFNSNTVLSYMVLFAMGGLSLFVDTLRNIKSILIIFISLRYIYNKSFVKFFLCYILALLFHISSIIILPLYFFINREYTKRFLLFVLFFSIFFFLFSDKILYIFLSSLSKFDLNDRLKSMIEKYVMTENRYSIRRGISLGLIEKLLTFSLTYLLYNKIYNGKMIMIVNSFIFYFLFYFVFSGFTEVSNRLSLIFVFSYWILWPRFLEGFHTRQMKELFLICLLTYSVLKCSQYSQPVQEYDNVLWGGHLRYSQRHSIHLGH